MLATGSERVSDYEAIPRSHWYLICCFARLVQDVVLLIFVD
jgi:hypothetical protein